MRAPVNWVYVLAAGTHSISCVWFVVIIIPFFALQTCFLFKHNEDVNVCKTVHRSAVCCYTTVTYLLARAAQRQKSNFNIVFPVIAFHYKRYSPPRSGAHIFNVKWTTASAQRFQPYDGMNHGRFKFDLILRRDKIVLQSVTKNRRCCVGFVSVSVVRPDTANVLTHFPCPDRLSSY